MAEPGTLAHFYANRAEYLTRTEARERIGVHRDTITAYLADGLPSYTVLRKKYVLKSELLEMFRAKRKRDDARKHAQSVDLPKFARG